MEIKNYETKKEIMEAIKLGKEVYYFNVGTIVSITDGKLYANYSDDYSVRIDEEDYDRCFSTNITYFLYCENTFRDNAGETITTKKEFSFGNRNDAIRKFIEIEDTFFNRGPFSYWSWGATIDRERFISYEENLPRYEIVQGDNSFKMNITYTYRLPISK